ncbi:hypothetical protein OHB14_31760 [Streptomyces sp. NBC_01613]|uniref:hypothetical protein n=1 Tax=Streptomyces sp. NBC_01613 TaxID=2975896 RepID=UPI003867D591
MTDESRATTPPTAHCCSRQRFRRGRALARRWPTALALALTGALIVGDSAADGGGDAVRGYAEALPLLPLLYVVINQAGSPRVTWPVLGAGVAVMFAVQAQDAVSPGGVLVAVALGVLLWGVVRGAPHGRTVLGIQAAGAIVFGALAVTGLLVDPDIGRYAVAAGWFFHGVWDFAHLRLKRLKGIVAPSFAEWCAVVDVVVGLELVFLG